MKRYLIGFLVVIALILIPSTVGAQDEWEDCCVYVDFPCCLAQCCAEQTFDYEVRYKEPVFLYFEEWGFGYWTSSWTSVVVEGVHDEFEAAESLGLRAGYDCWVSKVFSH